MSTTTTEISWTDRTWNPVRGCSRVSEGCRNCYAEGIAARFSGPGLPFEGFAKRVHGKPHWTGRVELVESALRDPLRWRKPATIFVNSMSDLFHEGLDFEQIDRVFAVMALCPQHVFVVLTKRTALAVEWADRMGGELGFARREAAVNAVGKRLPAVTRWPLPNVWIGASIENQAAADARAPDLLRLAALGWQTWVSYEPALGPVDWGAWLHQRVPLPRGATRSDKAFGAVVCGGESGPGARPMHPDWARAARDACQAAGVPFHQKQNGEWAECQPGQWHGMGPAGKPAQLAVSVSGETAAVPMHYVERRKGEGWVPMARVGLRKAGRLLDGRTHDDLPWPVAAKQARKAGEGVA